MKDNKKEDLQQVIESLESELKASLERERKLEEQAKTAKKESWFMSKVHDPGSRLGKVVRLPRTVYRVVRYPEVRQELRGETSKKNERKEGSGVEDNTPRFASLKFFYGEDTTPRVNLVVRRIEKELLKKAIELANSGDGCELRVVTYGEKAGVMKYREFKNEKGFPTAKKISFYSTVDQAKRDNPFELEMGKNDLFLMDEWGINEGE